MGAAPWGGSEELWSGAAARLLDAGHSVAAHVFAWHPRVPQIEKLRKAGASIIERPGWSRAPVRMLRFALGRPLSAAPFARGDSMPDLVVVSQGHPFEGVPVMNECAKRGWKYVSVTQANGTVYWPDDRRADAARTAYSSALTNFFVARDNWRMLCDQLACEVRHELVSNPFTVPSEPQTPPRIGKAGLSLACVARLDPLSKGQDLFLHALAQPRWRARPVEIGFFGTGRCESLLKALAARLALERATFHGHVENIEAVWAEHDALVLPSRMEGTPLALIEAMLCSRTAVVTDVGGNAELIEDNVSGFVAAAPTPDLLDEALERLWQRRGEMAALGEAARRRALAVVPRDPIGDFADRLLALVRG
ncbi:MAG TPA: glycosyltransferase family 4 protein [Usitatibacter sp.]|jgi:glycosyltransferase involved in cell wall biosynthesis|nr:glycosyltransferase family 4 protein [Usitatibacter sp.]